MKKPLSKRRVTLGAVALALGGLAPLITGAVGIHGYLTQGYFVARTGEIVSGPLGWAVCIAFILAGLGMMVLAARQYRRHTRVRG